MKKTYSFIIAFALIAVTLFSVPSTFLADEADGKGGINLADGDYTIEFETLYEKEDKPSTAATYLVTPAELSVKDGKGKIILTLTDHEQILDFSTEQNGEFQTANVEKVNEAANTRVVSFDVDNLDIKNARVQVYVAQIDYRGEYGIRLKFNEESIKKSDGTPIENPGKVENVENGYYTINHRVLHAEKFEKSMLGNYMKAPAKVVINGDKKTATITLTDHDSVTAVEVEQNGKFVPVKNANINKAENTRDISFEIDDLDAVVKVKVKVFVKEANYTGEYEARVFFEGNSLKSVVPLLDIVSHWGEEDIITAYKNNWIKGYPNGNFGPENKLTRMQAASLFVRILEFDERKKVPFKDVKRLEAPTMVELEKAYAGQIVGGFADNTFKPNNEVKRAQFALMIYRTYEKVTGKAYEPKKQADFSDIKKLDTETRNAISMLVELKIAGGYDDGTFRPANSVTRAQAAKMLVNYKEILDK